MEKNILYKVTQKIPKDCTDIHSQVCTVLNELERVYSVLIRSNTKEYVIEYNLSQEDEYNTFDTTISDKITNIIANADDKHIIGYIQPPIELMLKLYDPLICKLARKQCEHWNTVEYEDAAQTCRMVMLKLYRRGYYIHKSLLERSLHNEILMSLRHEKNRPVILSTEDEAFSGENVDDINVLDTIVDENVENENDEREKREFIEYVFGEVKAMLIDKYGERQFDQLLRDYTTKSTTQWSRKRIQSIKNDFKHNNITIEAFMEE